MSDEPAEGQPAAGSEPIVETAAAAEPQLVSEPSTAGPTTNAKADTPAPLKKKGSSKVDAINASKKVDQRSVETAERQVTGAVQSSAALDVLAGVAKELPCETSDEAEEERVRLYSEYDTNGNGRLSLSELQNGLRITMNEQLGKHGEAALVKAKPAIQRAYAAVKAVGRSKDDFVRFQEFRLLLLYLRRYFDLLITFSKMDTDDSKTMTKPEFEAVLPTLSAEYNADASDPEGAFAKIDANGSGTITFDEFSHWVLTQGIGKGAADELAAPLPASMQQGDWRKDGRRKGAAAKDSRPKESSPPRKESSPVKARKAPPPVPKVILPKPKMVFLNAPTIEPVEPMPDNPFQQYLKCMNRFAAAQKAS